MLQLEERVSERPRFAHESEVEFARLLDFYRVRWEYERRLFPLEMASGGMIVEGFTPDFFLPDHDTYVELTTLRQSLVTSKNRKVRRLRELYPGINILLLYRRDYQALLTKYAEDSTAASNSYEIDRVLLSNSDISDRVDMLANRITQDYAGTEISLIGILDGAGLFLADLMRKIKVAVTIDFIGVSKFRTNGESSVRIVKELDTPISGRHVILVDDLVDTGLTVNYVSNEIRALEPRSVEVCSLLSKPARRIIDTPLKYVGFEVPDVVLAGYGMDHDNQFRNLPNIAALKAGRAGNESS